MGTVSEFGALVKKYRKEKQLRQVDLAERSGLTQGHISKIESGEITELMHPTIVAIEKGLDLPPGTLRGATTFPMTHEYLKEFLESETARELKVTDAEAAYMAQTRWISGSVKPPITSWISFHHAIRCLLAEIQKAAEPRNAATTDDQDSDRLTR